jgi:hypothetical protein
MGFLNVKLMIPFAEKKEKSIGRNGQPINSG